MMCNEKSILYKTGYHTGLLKVFKNIKNKTPANPRYIFIKIKMPYLILFFIISSKLLAQEIIDQKVQDVGWTIDKCVNKFSWKDTVKTNVGYQCSFFDKDFIAGRTLKMSVVAPHSATHAPHKHSEDEFFFVLEGKTVFYLDGKTMEGEKYSAFYCPRNTEYGIRNIGDTELKYLVIKKYEKTN